MLIDQFYPVIGGAEQQALRISLKLIAKGHKVLVLTRKSDKDLSDFEEYRGIEIFRLPIIGVSGKQKLKSTYPALKWLRTAFEKRDPLLVNLGVSRDWDNLRDEPKFRDLLRQMNFLDEKNVGKTDQKS